MKYCLLFCLTLLSLKLSVCGNLQNISDHILKGTSFDLCSLTYEVGDCDQHLFRAYYDIKYKRCDWFFYTGCGGNPNNFHSKEECMKNCPGKIIPTRHPPHCLQEPEKGQCHDKIQRF